MAESRRGNQLEATYNSGGGGACATAEDILGPRVLVVVVVVVRGVGRRLRSPAVRLPVEWDAAASIMVVDVMSAAD